MRSFNFLLAAGCALLAAVSCGIRLWFAYELLALPCFAAVILALPFASLLHELGHMLFGAMCKIKAVPKFSLFGSSCCRLIPKTDKNLRARLFFTALGGIIVNLLVGTVIVFISVYTPAPVWLMFLVPSNVYLFVLNLIPVWFNSGKTDGLVCNDLLNNSDAGKVTVAVMTAQAQILAGKPAEQIDKKLLFGVPQIREDDPAFRSLTELRYEYFKAKGEEAEAQKYKERLEDLKKQYM